MLRNKVKNFQNFNWRDVIKVNLYLLFIVGLWPKGGLYKTSFYTFYAIISNILFIGCSTVFQAMVIFYAYSNILDLADALFVSLAELVVFGKLYCYIKNMALVQKLLAIFHEPIFQPVNFKQVLIVQKATRQWKIFYWVYVHTAAATVLFWTFYPVFDQSVKEYRLPFSAWYPFNTSFTPNYEITYMYQVVSIWFISVADVNMDMFIIALMMFTGVQCDILCDNLRNINSLDYHQDLVTCVHHYRAILRYF